MNSHVHVAVFIPRRADFLLAVHRSNTDTLFPNMWSLPGGKLEDGETEAQAAYREVWEETGLKLLGLGRSAIIRSSLPFTNYLIKIHVYIGQVDEEQTPSPIKSDVISARWIKPLTLIRSLQSHHYPAKEIQKLQLFLSSQGFSI